jgi:hypothetical protein
MTLTSVPTTTLAVLATFRFSYFLFHTITVKFGAGMLTATFNLGL